jgi:hypothetical protein
MTAMPNAGRLQAAYRLRAAALADADGVAQLQVDTWQAVDAALRGVIGPLGVAALLGSSLRRAARVHPWLAVPCTTNGAAPDLAVLRGTLAAQPLSDAHAAGELLFQVYEDLLNSLIGAGLAERLLRPVWQSPPDSPPAEDTMP